MSTNTGNLIHLASNEGYSLFRENKLSIDNIFIAFQNNQIPIPRNADLFYPQYLFSDHPIEYLQLIIGNNIIFNFPVDFCNKLCNFNCNGINIPGAHIYKIPWDILKFERIPLIGLQFHSVTFKIISNFNCTGKLYLCNYYLDNEGRRQLAVENTTQNLLIKQFQEQPMELSANSEQPKRLTFMGRIKGIFLDKINMDSINSFQLYLNGHLRLNYDQLMLSFFPQKISNDCYYIPFDNYHYFDNNWNTSINFDRIEPVTLKIKSNINQNIIVRAMNHNLLQIRSGMSFLHNRYDFCKIKNILEVMVPVPKLLEGDSFCPISYVNISEHKHYMKCHQCHKNYISDVILKWLEIKKNCPNCRTIWKNMQIYINCDNINSENEDESLFSSELFSVE